MRVTSLARRLGSAALVLSVGVGLAACSSDDSSDSGSSSSATDSGADDSSDDGSDDVTETEDAAALTELDGAGFYPAVMEAMREAETFNFQTVSESAGQSQTMEGQARFADGGMEMKASSTGAQPMELILLDKAMYLKSPDLGTGDKWLKVDLSDPNSLFGMIGKATDPEVMFKAMEAPKKLELVGTEEVDGVETNHYRITLDPAKYIAAMDFPSGMADMMPKELVTEMWVDGDDLPRKFSQTLEVPSAAGGKPTSTTSEGTYSDFGTDVEIEAPPADEVTEDMFPGAA
ncbi:hypothetical protein ASC64_05690 [Nocardioides sp. Root122]|uniref:hypothetical protein n=1 Tax=Nocardioides TaxID=1839 RepID=UPI000703611A|nr:MULTISPECIES: hypothetical protein [Nocardioides]KQV71501.1 hypothetical protein ASC64_05690 [Nocardioides sp. Root122]MCK9822506.1 hypothetical protein [Nocardioides cavernae]